MRDEWCLIAQLDGDESQVATVVSRLTDAVGLEGGRLTRAGQTIRVYSDSEQHAAEAEHALLGLLEETELGYELWQERWDEEAGAWEELAPDLDEEDGEEDGATQDEAEDEFAFAAEPGLKVAAITWQQAKLEVEARCASDDEAKALASQLEAMGLDTSVSGSSLRVPAADPTDAGAISDWLWAAAGSGTDIEVRKASFLDKLRP